MKNKYLLVLLTIILCATKVQAQAPAFRGIYLDGFASILGNTVKEDSTLQYAADSSFNYIALYDIHTVNFSNSASVNKLAAFIRKAREVYGIANIGAVGESYSTFQNKIAPYNNTRTNPNEKINVFNLEFEFWTSSSVNPGGYYCTQYLQPNGCNCDSSGGFKFFISNMHLIDSLASVQGATSETYLGWFNQGQGSQIQRNVDRILLHAYRVDPSSVYGYSKTRLQYLASNNSVVNVAPIFSSEPVFMGPWLNSHAMAEAYTKYKSDFNADNSSYVQYINMLGYQWFDYGYMPKPVPGAGGATSFVATITALGSTSFCSGGSVSITAGGGGTYLWSNGATTSSITVSSPGSYTCAVTKNGTTQTTSAVTVTVNASPTVSISQGALTNNVITITAAATAGSGTVSDYQWKLNNSTINGAVGSTFDATSSGDYSVVVTNSNGCTATSNTETCSITPPQTCTLTIPSNLTAITRNATSETLSWTSMPASDSIVIRYKAQNTQTYYYISLPNIGQTTLVLTGLRANTRYEWRLKTVCGSTSGSFSSKKYFTTCGYYISSTQQQMNAKMMGYSDTEEINNLEIFPNPAQSDFNLSYFAAEESKTEINIIDMNGRIVKTITQNFIEGDNQIRIETGEIENGVYFIQLKNDQISETKRLIIQK